MVKPPVFPEPPALPRYLQEMIANLDHPGWKVGEIALRERRRLSEDASNLQK
jgi:hypothetical protein